MTKILRLGTGGMLDLQRGIMRKNGLKLSFSKNETLLIQCLAQQLGSCVSREALTQFVWSDKSNHNNPLLYQIIHRVRVKLEDDIQHPKYLISVSGYGYMLIECSTVEKELDLFL